MQEECAHAVHRKAKVLENQKSFAYRSSSNKCNEAKQDVSSRMLSKGERLTSPLIGLSTMRTVLAYSDHCAILPHVDGGTFRFA